MCELMKEKFDKYWKDVHGLMAVATVLDPRIKLKLLHALFDKIYGVEVAAHEIAEIRKLLYNLVLQYQSSLECVETTEGTSSHSGTAAMNEGDDLVNDIFDTYLSSQPVVTTSYVRTELDLYLEEELIPRKKELDIINWWQYAGMKYPTLRNIARDIMAIPVTTVASESVFSTGGRIISPHRSRLAPKMVEALMCMQAWARADLLGPTSSTMNALLTCLEDEEETMDDPESTVDD
ncbi:hypothetical protein ACP70R_008567 [Stipagrostis hirtigluma subsp. patula]